MCDRECRNDKPKSVINVYCCDTVERDTASGTSQKANHLLFLPRLRSAFDPLTVKRRCFESAAILPVMASLLTPVSAQTVDPRGPTAAYAGRTQRTDEGISLASGEQIQNNGEPHSARALWKPAWISATYDEANPPLAMRLRREFVLPPGERVRSAVAMVSADRAYRLWVNGVLVSRGPDDPGRDYSPHERWSKQWLGNRVEIGPYLKPGVNVLAAEVYREHREDLSLDSLGFAFRLSIKPQPGYPAVNVESGADWNTKPVDTYGFGEIRHNGNDKDAYEGWSYDARQDEAGWRDPGFRGKGWSAARVVAPIWGPVAMSTLPPMMEAVWPYQRISRLNGNSGSEQAIPSININPGTPLTTGNGAFLIQYDRVLSSYLSLQLKGKPGTVVTVWPRERALDAPGRRPMRITLGEGITRFESPALESFSAVELTVEHASEPIQIQDIRATFVSQPVIYQGSFTSSDPHLNQLWTAARWQTQLCLQNRFLDSPDHQEPIGDPGDYLIEAEVAHLAFGSVAETPQFLREFAAILDHWMESHPQGATNFHTSYALLWLQTLANYYEQTGDAATARELAPSAYRLLARYADWVGPNGILSEAPNYLFMDWVTIGGFQTHHPPAVIGQGYLTAFYYRALADGMLLAKVAGDSKQVALYETQRNRLREAFNRELWDEAAGLYRDGKPFLNHNPTSENLLPPDRDIETHSPHVNALAVLYDLAPQERQTKILARVMKTQAQPESQAQADSDPLKALNVQPYFMFFVLAAEAHAGVLESYAPAQLARWVVNPQTRTFQESWRQGDWSHGWGAAPLIEMSRHVLGINPASPGYKDILLAPVPLGLSYASGSVATVRGVVSVAWTRSANSLTYKAVVPTGTTAVLDLKGMDGGRAMQLTVDGAGRGAYRSPITLASGTHEVMLAAAK